MKRWLVFTGALFAVLLWLAGPHWPETLDDTYITLAYVHEVLEHGALQWTTGERVEGYSNFLFGALLLGPVALGVDGGVAAHLLALGAALAMLAFGAWHARDLAGAVSVSALAASAPMAFWAVTGLETTLFGLWLLVGWHQVAAGGAFAAGVLGLAALTRPEGLGHLVLGTLAWWGLGRRLDGRWVGVWAAMVAYQLVRVWWFGAFWPTPFLVKVVSVGPAMSGLWGLVPLVGVLAVGSGRRWAPTTVALACAPALLGIGVMLAVGVDWMGRGRFALFAVLPVLGVALAQPVKAVGAGVWAPLVSLAVGIGAWDHLEVRTLPTPGASLKGWRSSLVTPMGEELSRVIERVPEEGTVILSDIGLIGQIPGVTVLDSAGLVYRDVALSRVDDLDARARFMARWPEVDLARARGLSGDPPPELPASMVRGFAAHEDFVLADGRPVRWYSRTTAAPSDAEVVQRWTVLAGRYPHHAGLRLAQMRAEARAMLHGRRPLGGEVHLYADGEVMVPLGGTGRVEVIASAEDGPARGAVDCGEGWQPIAVDAVASVAVCTVEAPALKLRFDNDHRGWWRDRNLHIWAVVSSLE